MSEYDDGETNPHFLPRRRPDSAVQQLEPEPMQPWDYHPTQIPQPERIQVRPRPHSRLPAQGVRPSRTPPEHFHQQPVPTMLRPPRSPPEYDQQPMPPEMQPSRFPPEHAHPQPPTPPRHHQPGRHSHPVEVPPVHQPRTKLKPKPKPKPKPSRQSRPHTGYDQGAHHENLMYPEPKGTTPFTWCGAVFCVILWLVIILGGLLVLIIFLMYRPRTPHFEISSASLNAVYLDMGYLLNADMTVLVNFTNPNKKVNVDFSYVILQLYFEKHLIANQYIEPFSAFSSENKLANVEMVSSQVRLPIAVTQKLITQIQRNRINFEVDGIFHARSNFGSLLRYSYWLYGHCDIEMTGPPSGIMITSHCRTKD